MGISLYKIPEYPRATVTLNRRLKKSMLSKSDRESFPFNLQAGGGGGSGAGYLANSQSVLEVNGSPSCLMLKMGLGF